MRRTLAGGLLVLAACAAETDDGVIVGTTRAALTDVGSFGTNPAQLTMKKYVPAKVPAGPRPLVVALHGCTQTPETYESAGWNDLADAWGFYVVYPQQNTQKNNSSGCFNWGGRWKDAPQAFVISPEALETEDIARGHDENESIKEMVDKMKADHMIDASRVFVTGLSAGGAMTAVLLATWPDVFSAGAIFAGVPYGCALEQKTTSEASDCMRGITRTPKQWGDYVRTASAGVNAKPPRVQLWQGTSDYVVSPTNEKELVKQWTDVSGADQTADVSDQVDGYPHAQYKDASGKVVVETFDITGKSHGTEIAASKPIDPANASGAKCGKPASYIIEAGICSTYYAAKFFGLDVSTPGGPSTNGGSSSSSSSSSGGGGADASTGSTGSTGGAATSGDKPADPSYSATCSMGTPSSSSGGVAIMLFAIATIWARRRPARPCASGTTGARSVEAA